MKKLFLLTIFFVFVLSCGAYGMEFTFYPADHLKIIVNNEEVSGLSPVIINDRTLIPLRRISEITGCKVDWYDADKRVVVNRPNTADEPLLVFVVNNPVVTVNWYNDSTGEVGGYNEQLEVPPVIINNSTYVPLRYITEKLGFAVNYNNGIINLNRDMNGRGDLFDNEDVINYAYLEFDTSGLVFEGTNKNFSFYSYNDELSYIVNFVDSVPYGESSVMNAIKGLEDLHDNMVCYPNETLTNKLTFPVWTIEYTQETSSGTYYCVDTYIQTNANDLRFHAELPMEELGYLDDVQYRINSITIVD